MNHLPSPFSSRACCSSETATDPPSEHGHARGDMVVAIIGMGLVCSGDIRRMRYATSEDLQNMQAGMPGIKPSSCDKTSSVAVRHHQKHASSVGCYAHRRTHTLERSTNEIPLPISLI